MHAYAEDKRELEVQYEMKQKQRRKDKYRNKQKERRESYSLKVHKETPRQKTVQYYGDEDE